MEKQFYIGQVVNPEDLFFRDEFIKDLWRSIKQQHVILTAPRRTGKTSVMTHLLQRPQKDWHVLYLNVQDTAHPMDFYLELLDEFNTRAPNIVLQLFEKGNSLIKGILNSIEAVEFSSLKVAIREKDPELATRWKDRLDDLLRRIRKTKSKVLIILDELPDMLLEIGDADPALLREFLGWFREQRQNPIPSQDNIRWLIGGSVNLLGTLDAMQLLDLMNDPQSVPLPIFTDSEVCEFVTTMLSEHGCRFREDVPMTVAAQLGRPIPYFLQMVTQELLRTYNRSNLELTTMHVTEVFNNLVSSPAARDKLQHYHSRITHYYGNAKEAAYVLLDEISLSKDGLSRRLLRQKYEEVRHKTGVDLPAHETKRAFNELMLDLENDFYISELTEDCYDFSGGLLKTWWRKYYA